MDIHFQQLSFRYPNAKQRALKDVNFHVPSGSIYALLGPNGSGKTTLLRLLLGRLLPESGSIHCNAPLAEIGLLVENPGVYGRLSIEEYLHFFGSFYKVLDLKSRINSLANVLELGDLGQKLSKLSLGQKQKVHVVRSLLHRPRLVLWDEPTSNLDPIARERVWELVRNEKESTFLISSHILPELEGICTHAAMLHQGQLLVAGSMDELANKSAVQNYQLQFASSESVSEEQIKKLLLTAGWNPEVHKNPVSLTHLYRSQLEA